jgi:hypothetical protein
VRFDRNSKGECTETCFDSEGKPFLECTVRETWVYTGPIGYFRNIFSGWFKGDNAKYMHQKKINPLNPADK